MFFLVFLPDFPAPQSCYLPLKWWFAAIGGNLLHKIKLERFHSFSLLKGLTHYPNLQCAFVQPRDTSSSEVLNDLYSEDVILKEPN